MNGLTAESPLISVVIPTYKLAHLLPATLRSLQSQTLKHWEAIVADDGSPDDVKGAAASFMEQDNRIRYVRQENCGLPAARNFGYRHCHPKSKYAMFLDADDLARPEALEKMCGRLEANPDVGMVCCRPQFVDSQGRPLPTLRWPRGYAYGPRRLGRGDLVIPFEAIYSITAPIICSLTVMRRSVFDQTGGFDENFGHNREDTDLFIMMALKAPVQIVDERLVEYRRHPGQMSDNQESLRIQAEKLYAKWRNRDGLSPAERTHVGEAERFRNDEYLLWRLMLDGCGYLIAEGHPLLAIRVFGGAVRRRLIQNEQPRKRGRFP